MKKDAKPKQTATSAWSEIFRLIYKECKNYEVIMGV